jgi:hypothetical protein
VVWLGMGRPGFGEFVDRPVCWLVGHALTHPIYNTTYPYQDREWPAVVWRCSRCSVPVIVI